MAASSGKLNVILDIDETLVYFIHSKYFSHSWDKLSAAEKSKYEVVTTKSGVFIKRPNLDKFLDYLFEHCTVTLWTWSDAEYARGIVDMFIKKDDRKLLHVLSERHASASTAYNKYSKDLRYVWRALQEGDDDYVGYEPNNTVLIDDLPSNAANAANRDNAILIEPFALFGEVKDRSDEYTDVSNDDALLRAIEMLKEAAKHIPENKKAHLFGKVNLLRSGLGSHLKTVALSRAETADVLAIGAVAGAVAVTHATHSGGTRRRHRTRRQRAARRHRTIRRR
jgi:hypothetical protein